MVPPRDEKTWKNPSHKPRPTWICLLWVPMNPSWANWCELPLLFHNLKKHSHPPNRWNTPSEKGSQYVSIPAQLRFLQRCFIWTEEGILKSFFIQPPNQSNNHPGFTNLCNFLINIIYIYIYIYSLYCLPPHPKKRCRKSVFFTILRPVSDSDLTNQPIFWKYNFDQPNFPSNHHPTNNVLLVKIEGPVTGIPSIIIETCS